MLSSLLIPQATEIHEPQQINNITSFPTLCISPQRKNSQGKKYLTKQRLNIPETSLRRTYSEGETSSFNDMSARIETSCHLIHTLKMWDSVQFYHLGKVYCSRCSTHRKREVSKSVCHHPFSSLLSIFNEGSNTANPHFSAFSVEIIFVQLCSSTHETRGKRSHFASSVVLTT